MGNNEKLRADVLTVLRNQTKGGDWYVESLDDAEVRILEDGMIEAFEGWDEEEVVVARLRLVPA